MRRAAVAAAAIGVLTASGCGVQAGSGAGGGSGVNVQAGAFSGTKGGAVLARSAAATSQVRTMRMVMTEKMDGGPIDIDVTASGEVDTAAKRAHLTTDLGGLFGGAGGKMEEVVDGTSVYVKAPMLSGLGGSTKPWLKVTVKKLAGIGGVGSSVGHDPGGLLEFLKSVGAKVTTVGTEELRGVETTHVRTTVNLQQLISKANAERKAKLDKALASLGASDFAKTALPIDAWVGTDGYVRKVVMSFAFAGGTKDASIMDGTKLSVTMELYDFNQPVDIQVPDPADVGTLGSILGQTKKHHN
jgi:hypothetical protein